MSGIQNIVITGSENPVITGGVSTAITGDLLKQVESLISGKLENIQRSITGSKDLIVMQVKADLGTEYQKIIGDANGGISNILAIFGIGVPVLVGIVSYIAYSKIKDIERVIEGKEKAIKDKEDNIIEIGKKLESYKKEVEEFVNKQEDAIYERVMQRNVDSYYNRIQNQPRDIESNLFGILTTIDHKYISNSPSYFNILFDIYKLGDLKTMGNAFALIYQFFPEKVFYHKELYSVANNLLENLIEKSLYDDEIKVGTEKMLSYLKGEDVSPYNTFFQSYFLSIYKYKNNNPTLISNIQTILKDGFEEYKIDNYDHSLRIWKS